MTVNPGFVLNFNDPNGAAAQRVQKGHINLPYVPLFPDFDTVSTYQARVTKELYCTLRVHNRSFKKQSQTNGIRYQSGM